MLNAVRTIAGAFLITLLFYAAAQAVQDCPTGLFVYENCLWLWVRDQLGLPQSKLARALTLEVVGLALLVGFYGTLRYVFPFGARIRLAKPESNVAAHSEPSSPR